MAKQNPDKSAKIIHAHPIVPPFVQHTARAYHEADMLDKFMTTFYVHPEYWLSNLILKIYPGFKHELSRRALYGLPIDKVEDYPFKEILRTLSSRYGSAVTTDMIWEWAETSFDRWVASRLSNKHSAVHCYEHAGLASLQKAKQLGIMGIYEQPSQHHAFFTKVVQEQIAKFPNLKSAGTELLYDAKAERRNQRRDEELATADLILCNSGFTKRTLLMAGVEAHKVEVIPYGFPEPVEDFSAQTQEKVIFLNAGTQNLRKAMHLLYSAWRKCNFPEEQAELWLIGKMALPEHLRNDMPGKVIIRDSIPRNELMEIYQQASVFVLPTLADGFGMVITEAMSRGVPVITTENSGGPDIITHQKDGLLIPAGDEEALISQMKWCVAHRHLLANMGVAALEKAASWQWSDYRAQIIQKVNERIVQTPPRHHSQ